MNETVMITDIEKATHDVLHITAERPAKITYLPGQAADISINQKGWENELRAFTFTSLAEEPFIEFYIKTYPSRGGVTNQLLSLQKRDEIIVHEPFGDIQYKGEGVFIAGGAGITPFIAIFKYLEKNHQLGNNQLIFANKTKSDIILEERFSRLLGKNFINVLSEETHPHYHHGYVSESLIREHLKDQSQYFYLCAPPPMMTAVEKILLSLGIDNSRIVKEGF